MDVDEFVAARFEELRSELIELRKTQTEEERAAGVIDIFNTEFVIDTLKPDVVTFYDEMRKRIARSASYVTYPRPVTPRLFHNSQPVLRFVSHGLRGSFTKARVEEIISRADSSLRFDVTRARSTGRTTVVRVKCGNLSSSLRLQCLSILNRLVWSYTNKGGKETSGVIKLEPSHFQSDQVHSFTRKRPVLDSEVGLFRLIRVPAALALVMDLLEPRDNLALYQVFHEHELVLRLMASSRLDLSWPFLQGPEACAWLNYII